MRCNLSQLKEIVSKANNIVVTGHIHPDGDCIGSILAVDSFLKRLGKKSTVILDDEVPRYLEFLCGNTIINQPKEIILADLLIILDSSDLERIGRTSVYVKAPVLNIDHHKSNLMFADYVYLDSDVSATGEIIVDIFKEFKHNINEYEATALYTAIATDCGFFKYANTSAKTLSYAGLMVEKGAQPHVISEALEVRSRENIMHLVNVLKTLEFYADGKIASITITDKPDGVETDGYISYPRSIEGVEAALMFTCDDADSTRVSMRAKTIDVSEIALFFGGGGHARAAGCTVNKPVAEAKEIVIKKVEEAIKGGTN